MPRLSEWHHVGTLMMLDRSDTVAEVSIKLSKSFYVQIVNHGNMIELNGLF